MKWPISGRGRGSEVGEACTRDQWAAGVEVVGLDRGASTYDAEGIEDGEVVVVAAVIAFSDRV